MLLIVWNYSYKSMEIICENENYPSRTRTHGLTNYLEQSILLILRGILLNWAYGYDFCVYQYLSNKKSSWRKTGAMRQSDRTISILFPITLSYQCPMLLNHYSLQFVSHLHVTYVRYQTQQGAISLNKVNLNSQFSPSTQLNI